MWFFMYTCYLLSALSFLLMALIGLQGYFHFAVLSVNHPTLAMMAIIIYLFAETLVMFFFVGTGVSIKEYMQSHATAGDYHRQSLQIKRRLYPPTLANLLLMMLKHLNSHSF